MSGHTQDDQDLINGEESGRHARCDHLCSHFISSRNTDEGAVRGQPDMVHGPPHTELIVNASPVSIRGVCISRLALILRIARLSVILALFLIPARMI
jgi:hypothetical protein